MRNMRRSHFLSVCLLVLLSSCQSTDEPGGAPGEGVNVVSDAHADEVLVRLGDDAVITLRDLEAGLERVAGADAARELGQEDRDKVLESIISTRAIAIRQYESLNEQAKARFEARMQAIRDEELTRDYLRVTSAVPPVTDVQIRAAWEAEPERWGAGVEQRYEMIYSEPLSAAERDALLNLLVDAVDVEDWSAWTERQRENGYPLRYRRSVQREHEVPDALVDRLRALESGEVSSPVLAADRLHLLRSKGSIEVGARPLSEVRDQIRREIEPRQINEAIRAASNRAREDVEIVHEQEQENEQ